LLIVAKMSIVYPINNLDIMKLEIHMRNVIDRNAKNNT
jgi:hypothetical protein